ncbi:unnamed protein product [Vitrella brassicaformis CCMP3155]|uniref:Uncharacterized protein n=1 Tax=Vitrella brassicaformis (strain CCMP3155) TaxID=1169540 RepID=A0A0G4ETA0_VITBC|nr:unnamed protein product [Vitrella brassicaformis CCMP3155]|eukprot:CEM01668.1 unnamed protein product [Vitrella brassicaformis CCMP3155]
MWCSARKACRRCTSARLPSPPFPHVVLSLIGVVAVSFWVDAIEVRAMASALSLLLTACLALAHTVAGVRQSARLTFQIALAARQERPTHRHVQRATALHAEEPEGEAFAEAIPPVFRVGLELEPYWESVDPINLEAAPITLPLTEEQKLLVRKAYVDIAKIIMDRHNNLNRKTGKYFNVLLRGSPGVGLSWFLLFFLAVLKGEMHRGKNFKIWFVDNSKRTSNVDQNVYELSKDGFAIVLDPLKTLRQLQKTQPLDSLRRDWLLIDGFEGGLFGAWPGSALLAASARHDNYNDFKKELTLNLLMPTWTEEEVSEALEGTEWLDQMDNKRRYAGGIIHDYLRPLSSLKKDVKLAVAFMKYEDARRWRGEAPRGAVADKFPETVLMSLDPGTHGPYTFGNVVWRSSYILGEFIRKLTKQELKDELDIIMDPRKIVGKEKLFEGLVHEFLARTRRPITLEPLSHHVSRMDRSSRASRMQTPQDKLRGVIRVSLDSTQQDSEPRLFSRNRDQKRPYANVHEPGFWVPVSKKWTTIDSLYIDSAEDVIYLFKVTADSDYSASGFDQTLIDNLRTSPAIGDGRKTWRIVWAIPQGGLIKPQWPKDPTTREDIKARLLFQEYVFELPAGRAVEDITDDPTPAPRRRPKGLFLRSLQEFFTRLKGNRFSV